MHTEFEMRILEVKKDEILKKLTNLNALFIGDWIQKRYVYDFNPKEENKWIRLRTNGQKTTLAIKKLILKQSMVLEN